MAGIFGGSHAQMFGKPGPHPVPAEHFAVDDVEGVVAGDGRGCCPEQVLGDDAPVGDVDDGFVLLRRAWEDERAAGFLADRRA